jgi:hypothetical protein
MDLYLSQIDILGSTHIYSYNYLPKIHKILIGYSQFCTYMQKIWQPIIISIFQIF